MVLASKTGWTEQHIRWDLPLSRGYAYFHAARLMEGDKTQWPGQTAPVEEWLATVRAWAASALTPAPE
jgi:hypothetical protein